MDNLEGTNAHLFLEQEEQGHLVHDMKSPFNGIVGLSEPLAKMSKDAEKKKQLTWMNVSGARWCKHIEATVESAPLASGQVEIKADIVNLGFLVEEACALLAVSKDPREKPIKNESVTITNNVPYEGLMATGSDVHTAKCIFHLILNAIKFTDNGSVSVTQRTEGDTHIVIVITDTGIGMSSDQVSQAFEPFVKFTNRLPGESLGLGLTSTKEYIDHVGGKVVIDSELAKGTTAELWVPRSAANIGKFDKGPFGFGYYMHSYPKHGPWLLQKRGLGILTIDLLPAHYGLAGMADLLFNSEQKPQQKKQFAMIQRSANRVVEVLSEIRDATLRSEPSLVPRTIPCLFTPIAETIVSELSKAIDKKAQPLKQKDVEFFFEANGAIPTIAADPFNVYRIVYHLCENALKFTKEGKVVLAASKSADGGLQVSITDTGIGFDMGMIEEIFKPLHRLLPDKYYGLGLGLCLVKDMTDRTSRSSIEVNSIPDKGTTVILTLAEGTAMDSPPPAEIIQPVAVNEAPKKEERPQVAPEIPEPPAVDKPPTAPVVQETIPAVPEAVPTPDKKEETLPTEAVKEAKIIPPPEPVEVAKKPDEPETTQFIFADVPKEEEDQETVKRKALAGDKYRVLVEMDDGSEPPSIQAALSNLSLAVEILKERIAVANATSSNIKSLIRQIEAKYH
jgi:signal transduction histidine kinase